MASRIRQFLVSMWRKHDVPVSWYRLSVSLLACAYLFYFAARNPVGSLFVGVVVLLTVFILDDWLRVLRLPRKADERPLSIR